MECPNCKKKLSVNADYKNFSFCPYCRWQLGVVVGNFSGIAPKELVELSKTWGDDKVVQFCQEVLNLKPKTMLQVLKRRGLTPYKVVTQSRTELRNVRGLGPLYVSLILKARSLWPNQ